MLIRIACFISILAFAVRVDAVPIAGYGSVIDSITNVEVTIGAAETTANSSAFAAVDEERSIIIYCGHSSDQGPYDPRDTAISWSFTTAENPTQITARRGRVLEAAEIVAKFIVIQFKKNIVRYAKHGNAQVLTGTNSNTVAISLTNKDKAIVIVNGLECSPDAGEQTSYAHMVITDETTLTIARTDIVANNSELTYYTVIEFY